MLFSPERKIERHNSLELRNHLSTNNRAMFSNPQEIAGPSQGRLSSLPNVAISMAAVHSGRPLPPLTTGSCFPTQLLVGVKSEKPIYARSVVEWG